MPREGYTAINLKEPMAQAIDKLIQSQPELGWKSRDDFVRDAIRDALFKFRITVELSSPEPEQKEGAQ